ncbi:MAG: MFS transporter, partial [Oscillospiraceae bacterium]|nr:MFS transporter [Oscillospiraceae bacterium]
MKTTKQPRPFGIRDSLAYAAGDLGCNMSFALKGTIMPLFWTQVMGLSAWYSLLIVILQVWDAINDPLIGSIVDSDRHKYKRNKFLQYIWAGSIGLIIGGALCFIPVPGAPEWAKIVIFMAGYIIWDAFYTVANVPYGSLLSLISKEPADRASLSAWRSVGSIGGNMIPMVILPFLIYNKDQTLNGPMVFVAALVMGALGFICFQFMIKNTEIRVDTEVSVNEDQPKFNVFKAMGNFLKNRPAVGATLAAMGMFIGMQGANTAVSVTFQIYFKNAQISGLISMFSMIPIVVFTPLARKMVTKFGKKELSIFGSVCYIAGAAVLLLAPLGIIPVAENNTGIDLALYVIDQLIISL